jgi:hypothetical protein
MAIDGNIIASATHGNPSEINYTMFVAIFSMATLILMFVTLKLDDLIPTPILLVLDGLNVLFFFAGAVALAVALGAHSCSNQVSDSRNGFGSNQHRATSRVTRLQTERAI